jgi:hypothetical protein
MGGEVEGWVPEKRDGWLGRRMGGQEEGSMAK